MIWHRRMLRALCFYLLVALAGPVGAREGATFTDYFAAADQLDRLAASASASGGPPPSVSDPEVAAVFARTTETPRIFNRTYQLQDFPAIVPVISRTLGFLRLYYSWAEQPGLDGDAQARFHNGNLVLYQDETIPIVTFAMDGMGQIFRIFSPGRATMTFGRPEGIVEARDGLAGALSSMVELVEMPGITADHQLAIAQALDRDAADLAGALTTSQRNAVAGQIELLRSRLGPQARASLDHALISFNNPACTGLCAI